jgi:hypothetical protein
MEKTGTEKTSLFLIYTGMAIAALGAIATFFLAPAWLNLFYAGFLMAIAGFALAVLSKAGEKKEN